MRALKSPCAVCPTPILSWKSVGSTCLRGEGFCQGGGAGGVGAELDVDFFRFVGGGGFLWGGGDAVFAVFGAVRRRPRGEDRFDDDFAGSGFDDAQSRGGGVGEVDETAGEEGAAVVDADDD